MDAQRYWPLTHPQARQRGSLLSPGRGVWAHLPARHVLCPAREAVWPRIQRRGLGLRTARLNSGGGRGRRGGEGGMGVWGENGGEGCSVVGLRFVDGLVAGDLTKGGNCTWITGRVPEDTDRCATPAVCGIAHESSCGPGLHKTARGVYCFRAAFDCDRLDVLSVWCARFQRLGDPGTCSSVSPRAPSDRPATGKGRVAGDRE